MEELVIRKVEKDSELMQQLLHFVQNYSWTEVKDHMVQLIGSWAFTDWETPFAALVHGRIIGMVTLMKSDYYPLPEIFPWISALFVSEAYRGNRISEKLIEAANAYAAELGFHKTYIPTEFVGLYEKYGYQYVKDIVNYGNGVDRLYVKMIGTGT